MTLTADSVLEIAEAVNAIERVRAGGRVTIYRDLNKSPSWSIQFNMDGKQFRKSLKTTSKKWALELAKKKDAELVLGLAQAPAKRAVTILQAIEIYLRFLIDRARDPETLKTYERDLLQFAHYCAVCGITKLKDLTAELLEGYQRELAATGVRMAPGRPQGKPNAPKTVLSKMKTIRQLIRFAVKRRMVTEEPSAGYCLPKDLKKKAVFWSAEELKKVLDHADAEVKSIFDFLRYTGLRSAELCWLTKEDVDFGSNAHVKIRRKTCPQSGITWHPKHGNERTVPLATVALEIVKKAYAESPGPWLFYAPDTHKKQPGHWTTDRLWGRLKKAMKSAGVARGTVHTLRHVFCSFLANRAKEKVTAFQVMQLMGHSSMDIVLSYYHCDDRALSAAITSVDFAAMLDGAGKEGQT